MAATLDIEDLRKVIAHRDEQRAVVAEFKAGELTRQECADALGVSIHELYLYVGRSVHRGS